MFLQKLISTDTGTHKKKLFYIINNKMKQLHNEVCVYFFFCILLSFLYRLRTNHTRKKHEYADEEFFFLMIEKPYTKSKMCKTVCLVAPLIIWPNKTQKRILSNFIVLSLFLTLLCYMSQVEWLIRSCALFYLIFFFCSFFVRRNKMPFWQLSQTQYYFNFYWLDEKKCTKYERKFDGAEQWRFSIVKNKKICDE